MNRVLLACSDPQRREAITAVLENAGYDVLALDGAAIDPMFAGVALVDDRASLATIRGVDPEMPVVLLTADSIPAVPVWEILSDGYDDLALKAAVARAAQVRWLTLENRRLASAIDDAPDDLLVGRSPAIVAVRDAIAMVAGSDADVLLAGETGTGKARAARMIHRAGAGRQGPFVALACAAFPDALIDRELAEILRIGRGTLFLDDAEAASPALRARLGSLASPELRIVAAVAATPSEEQVRPLLGDRADTCVRLRMPALRDRRDDIPLLFAHLLDAAAGRLRTPVPSLSVAARHHLLDHDWPGNVRELSDFADRVMLGLADLPALMTETGSLPMRVDAFERLEICAALAASGGDAGAAMAALGLPRKTFYYKVQRHEIDIAGFRTRARPRRVPDVDTKKPGHF